MNSPVPTSSCQRASTSPRSRSPSRMPCSTGVARPRGRRCDPRRPARWRRRPGRRRRRRARRPPGRARRARRRRSGGRRPRAPAAERASCVEPVAQRRDRPARAAAPAVEARSRRGRTAAPPPRPCSASISVRCGAISSSAPGGTRFRTRATAVPRSRAVRSSSHGTASA